MLAGFGWITSEGRTLTSTLTQTIALAPSLCRPVRRNWFVVALQTSQVSYHLGSRRYRPCSAVRAVGSGHAIYTLVPGP